VRACVKGRTKLVNPRRAWCGGRGSSSHFFFRLRLWFRNSCRVEVLGSDFIINQTKPMKSGVLLLAASMLFAFGLLQQSQAAGPVVGDKPPPLQLEKVLQAPAKARVSWDGLKGKVVVLEFWATWCGPCIAAIPHMNELSDAFKDQPVQFIAITDEEESVVAPFLKRKPIQAWVGLDTDKSMQKDYAISGIPHTVVIDRKGKVAAVTYPTALTKQHLTDLVAGRKLDLAAPSPSEGLRPGRFPGSADVAAPPLFQIRIRPSSAPTASSASGQGQMTLLGTSVLAILSSCHSINSIRIITNCSLPEGTYDYVVKIPAKKDDLARRWLQQAVETTFGLTTKREIRELDVYVLTAPDPGAPQLSPTVSTGGSSASSAPGSMRGVNVSVGSLTWTLESALKKPVLDETKLTNRYDLELKWEAKGLEPASTEALAKAVREQLGLELSAGKRPVEVLLVDKVAGEGVIEAVPAPVRLSTPKE